MNSTTMGNTADNSATVVGNVLDIYDELLRTIWLKITPTLGNVTVITIVERAVSTTAGQHPVLRSLSVDENGVSLQALKAAVDTDDLPEVKEAFKELVASLFDILAKLTGHILVDQLVDEAKELGIA